MMHFIVWNIFIVWKHENHCLFIVIVAIVCDRCIFSYKSRRCVEMTPKKVNLLF